MSFACSSWPNHPLFVRLYQSDQHPPLQMIIEHPVPDSWSDLKHTQNSQIHEDDNIPANWAFLVVMPRSRPLRRNWPVVLSLCIKDRLKP